MSVEVAEPSIARLVAMGAQVHGLIHVGANDGAEVPWYQAQGIRPIVCFEPHPDALRRASERFSGQPDIWFIGCGLGATSGAVEMTIPEDGDDEKTSRYAPVPTDGHEWTKVGPGSRLTLPIMRFDEWQEGARLAMSTINTLVVDAQGMELEVLEGFGHQLNWFTFLAIECSEKPVYDGEPSAQQVIEWLRARGFVQATEIREHDDVCFIRKGTGL
jgi:FkbM family methyltransferase